jgi:hypothetical protein
MSPKTTGYGEKLRKATVQSLNSGDLTAACDGNKALAARLGEELGGCGSVATA